MIFDGWGETFMTEYIYCLLELGEFYYGVYCLLELNMLCDCYGVGRGV